MTLFDAIVALVILGLAAVGFLGAFQASTRSAQHTAEWVQAVGYAEAAMEDTKLGSTPAANEQLAAGFSRDVTVQPWRGTPSMEQVTVTITMPRGATFVLQRLVPAP